MLSEKQLKAIELLATGHTIKDVTQSLGVKAQTIYQWRQNPEFLTELANATDVFAKECLKERSRAYRTVSKKISDEILSRIDKGELSNYDIMQLIKMLEKTIGAMNSDETSKKISSLTAIQNNIHINDNGLTERLKDPDVMKKFGQFLIELEPSSIETIVEFKQKQEEQME